MGEVAAGDRLLGADGRPTTVMHAFDVMHDRPCYEVEFSDGVVDRRRRRAPLEDHHPGEPPAARRDRRARRRSGREPVATIAGADHRGDARRSAPGRRRLNHSVDNARAARRCRDAATCRSRRTRSGPGSATAHPAPRGSPRPTPRSWRTSRPTASRYRTPAALTRSRSTAPRVPTGLRRCGTFARAWLDVRPVCGGRTSDPPRHRLRDCGGHADPPAACSAATSTARSRPLRASACSATSTSRRPICARPRRSAGRCSPACWTPTAP